MLTIDMDREVDGRWIAEVPALSGVLVYGDTKDQARAKAMALAFHVLADMIEHGEPVPDEARDFFIVAA
jgi:predicted RNase H-like HicB family nuclease